MWRFWRWPRPPMDELTAMALLVGAVRARAGDWQCIEIRRKPGGVVFSVVRDGMVTVESLSGCGCRRGGHQI